MEGMQNGSGPLGMPIFLTLFCGADQGFRLATSNISATTRFLWAFMGTNIYINFILLNLKDTKFADIFCPALIFCRKGQGCRLASSNMFAPFFAGFCGADLNGRVCPFSIPGKEVV